MTDHKWQPIETAPKDGSDVLLVHRDGTSMIVAFWDDEGLKAGRWQTADGIAYHESWPDHWMPLPEPPQ